MSEEFIRFISVGVINTSVNYAVYSLFFLVLGFDYLVAGACGFLSGAATGYLLNRSWTFRNREESSFGSVRYLAIQGVGLSVHISIQAAVTSLFACPKLFSQLAGIAVTTFLNFGLSKVFVFRSHQREDHSGSSGEK